MEKFVIDAGLVILLLADLGCTLLVWAVAISLWRDIWNY
jgi:hypothetical protein